MATEKTISDETLVMNARSGDTTALDTLMNRFKPLAKAKAKDYFLTGGDLDDLMQVGMIGLYKAVLDFDTEKSVPFASFASLCIVRQIQTAIKAASRKKHLPLNTSLSLHNEELPIPRTENPETLFLGREAYHNIDEFLNKNLSHLELEVLALYMEEKSHAEIAAAIGKPPKTVENALGRIRRKITPYL